MRRRRGKYDSRVQLPLIRPSRRPGGVLAALGAGAIAVLLLAGCGSSVHYSGFVRKPAPDVGALSLPDTTQGLRPLKFVAPAHGLLLVYFGYAMCPDICPTTLSDLGVALRGLKPNEQKRVEKAVITVDPNRDTATVMTKYVHAFFRDGHALRTTDVARLAAVARAFGAAYRVTKAKDGTIEVVHTAFVYAVDNSGRIRLQWSFGTKPPAYRADVQKLLSDVR